MSVRISNIYIKNFKLFDEFNKIVDIENKNLVLLDGPNGYGKTTVFDAIELALTGKIKRVDDNAKLFDGKKKYKSFILIRDENKEAIVSVTLIKDNNKLELIRKYTPQNIKGESVKKNPQKIFEKFEFICKLNGEIVKGHKQKATLTEFGIYESNDIFNRCCYLSQDENVDFFKEGDDDRTQDLSFLFDTNIQEKEISNMEKTQKRCNKILKKYEGNLPKLKEEIEKQKEKESKKDYVDYIKLFNKTDIVWDKENYEVNSVNYKKITNELSDFMYIAKNIEQCKVYIKRNKYNYLLKEFCEDSTSISMANNALQYTLNFYKKIDGYEVVKTNYNNQQNLIKQKHFIEAKQYNNLDINIIKQLMDFKDETISEIKNTINEIENIKKSENTLSTVISGMNSTREKLMTTFKSDVVSDKVQDHVCPLCGYDWTEADTLLKAVKKQTKKLTQLYTDDTLRREKLEKDLEDKYFKDTLVAINNNIKELIDKKYVQDLQKACRYKDSMDKILEQLKDIEISIEDKIVKNGSVSKDVYDEICNLIKKQVPECRAEISDKLNTMDFNRYYSEYLKSDINELERITNPLIEKKKKYIDYLNYTSFVKELEKLQKNYINMENRYNKLKDIDKQMKVYIQCRKSAIIDYKKSIINDIEPLLYIYSGKIIQQKFGGNGIIIDNRKKSDFKIVSNCDSDQDIIHSMSSGQLTSVALAFLLCMNKVYNSDKISILLIDDPLQTVDDVNMVGFVDLIRHEFSDMQIIVATHENKFANYITYKFYKAGHNCENYNMRKLLLDKNEAI